MNRPAMSGIIVTGYTRPRSAANNHSRTYEQIKEGLSTLSLGSNDLSMSMRVAAMIGRSVCADLSGAARTFLVIKGGIMIELRIEISSMPVVSITPMSVSSLISNSVS